MLSLICFANSRYHPLHKTISYCLISYCKFTIASFGCEACCVSGDCLPTVSMRNHSALLEACLVNSRLSNSYDWPTICFFFAKIHAYFSKVTSRNRIPSAPESLGHLGHPDILQGKF